MDEAIEGNEELAHLKHWLGDHEIEIQDASEPSDIIWENRHFTPWDRRKKEFVVYTVMFIMLFVSFIIIFILSDISAKALAKYPIIADCEKLLGFGVHDTMEKYATLEHRTNAALEEAGYAVSYTKGYVQCFCNAEATAAVAPDAEYSYDGEEF